MTQDLFRLDGKTAVVTGAGKGLGRGIAIRLAKAGTDVVISSRTKSDLDSLAEEITACVRLDYRRMPACDGRSLMQIVKDGFHVVKVITFTFTAIIVAGCVNMDTTSKPVLSDIPVERLFLQQVTASSAIVKWRGGGDHACYTDREDLNEPHCITAVAEQHGNGTSHKYVQLSGLNPDQVYFYSVDGRSSVEQQFRTAPATGNLPEDGNTRIWIIGDSGTASAIIPAQFGGTGELLETNEPQMVRDGYLSYVTGSGEETADLFLLLGDNAYVEGSDKQWQIGFFDIYPDVMNKAAVWPTIGNHEMGAAFIDVNGGIIGGGASTSADHMTYDDLDDTTPDSGMPYLDIFSLPARGEAGGVPSGSEQYYSFDYANVHIVSLDSQVTARDPVLRDTMREWLIMDLAANLQDWTIVIFHHPPYSKSSHDSDTEAASRLSIDLPMLDMRREFTSVFEEHGVDLVYGGHSHAYERSWYLHGHRGDAETFNAARHTELNRSGVPASGQGDEVYGQISHSGQDDRVVYTVAGSSGQVSTGHGLLDHPAHFQFPDGKHGLAMLGSVVIDASRSDLTASFIDETGTVHDHVTITR